MKKVFFFGLIISLMILSCAKQESKFPQGTWEKVQTLRVVDGNAEVRFPVTYTGFQIKMWTETNWMFIQRYYRDTITTIDYGTGTYTLDGNQYEEDILYLGNEIYDGTINKNMTMELKNDTLYQSYHPLMANGQQPDSVTACSKPAIERISLLSVG